MDELPEPWKTAAERAGVRQTFRGIADAAGSTHPTVRRLIEGGSSSQPTIEKVAAALHETPATIMKWADIEVSDWGLWTPPREAHRLNPRARAAIEELIRVMAQGGQQDGRTLDAEKSDELAGRRQRRTTAGPGAEPPADVEQLAALEEDRARDREDEQRPE